MKQWSARLIYVVLLALPTSLAALTDPTRPAHFYRREGRCTKRKR